MRWIVFVCVMLSLSSYSQYKSFIIGVKGDTLNRVDNDGLKQGKWVMHAPPLRGEPGYDEEGIYKNGKKEGTWRKYSEMGDLLAIENYMWGFKNGACSYYNLYGLEHEESWKAIDPKNPYDTIDVPDLHSDTVYQRIVKVEASTVRHGTWRYYNPQTGMITKTEDYILDQLVDPRKKFSLAIDSTSMAKVDTTSSKQKPKEVLEYEKKNSNKKKIKVRDGATGVP